jgi:cytochrome c-type biogenesis protein CcmH
MEPDAVAWGWPLAALVAGLVLGSLLVWRMRRAPRSVPPADVLPLELRDLDGRLDVLVLQLREMQDLAAKRSPEQLARERYALELQAAEVLRDRERRAGAVLPARKGKGKGVAPADEAAPAPAPPTGFLAARPDLRGFVWGAATVGVLALLFLYVNRAAGPRQEGGSVTGNLPSSAPPSNKAGAPAEAATDAEDEAEVRAALKRNPDDFDARLDLAMLHLRRRDLMAVWDDTQYVLAKEPGHPRALSYQALVRMAMGQSDVAVKMLKQALAKDPDLFEGYLHLALVQTRAGHDKEAEAAIAEAKRRFPDRADMLARVLPEIRASGKAEGSTAAEVDAHAAVPPPAAAEAEGGTRGPAEAPGAPPAMAGAPAGDAGTGGLAGVIELPAALASRVGPNAIVFVTVRESGASGGPPVAVKRLPASSFPLRFAIGPGDSMMGQPLPGRARVEARVDSDGDPLTRTEGDPTARLDDVPSGSSSLRLVLR